MVKELVCGMKVDEAKAPKIEHSNKTYYFCEPTCQWAFTEKLEQFASEKS